MVGPAARQKRRTKGGATAIDAHVGNRLRQRRVLLGMSQENLGLAVGLTFQQIQKYERGANRIGASRLYEFSKVLDVPVGYFFDELPDEALSPYMRKLSHEAPDKANVEQALMTRREILELVRVYDKVRDPRVRKSILYFVRAVSAA